MAKSFRLRTQDSVMCEIFERIKQNKPFDKNLKPYNKDIVEKIINYFISTEEYEKCEVLNNFLKIRFNHEISYKKNG
jgi:hypothetical protein